MTAEDRVVAGLLLNRKLTAVSRLAAIARASGLGDSLEALARLTSPLAELGFLAYSGKLELTSAGQETLSAWRQRHGIGG
jgi:hypothetical protein